MSLPIPGSNDLFLPEAPPILQYNKLSLEERKSFFSDQVDLTEEDFPRQFNTITAHPAKTVQQHPTSAPAPALNDLAVFPQITIEADGGETEQAPDIDSAAAVSTTTAASAVTAVLATSAPSRPGTSAAAPAATTATADSAKPAVSATPGVSAVVPAVVSATTNTSVHAAAAIPAAAGRPCRAPPVLAF